MDNVMKARENRIRRMLARQGYSLSKNNRRDPRAYDYGHYTISQNGEIVFGATVGRTLDDVEAWALAEDAARKGAGAWEQVGEVAVDTGRLMLADPCLIDNVIPDEFRDEPVEDDHACLRHANGRGLATIIMTGYGDGFYPVSVIRTAEGRIAAVRVDFIASEPGEIVRETG